jgi:hypothetical protein
MTLGTIAVQSTIRSWYTFSCQEIPDKTWATFTFFTYTAFIVFVAMAGVQTIDTITSCRITSTIYTIDRYTTFRSTNSTRRTVAVIETADTYSFRILKRFIWWTLTLTTYTKLVVRARYTVRTFHTTIIVAKRSFHTL